MDVTDAKYGLLSRAIGVVGRLRRLVGGSAPDRVGIVVDLDQREV